MTLATDSPSPFAMHTPTWVRVVALIGLYIWALFGWLGVAGSAIGAALIMVAVMFDAHAWRSASRFPIFWLVMAMIAYLALRTAWAVWQLPETRAVQLDAAGSWLQLMMFLPVAWYMGANLRRVNHLWMLAAGGLLFGSLHFVLKPENRDLFGSAVRSGFHLGPPITYGLYVGVVLVGLLLLATRLWGTPRISLWRLALWLACLGFAGQCLLQTVSRGPLLAMVLVAPVALAANHFAQPGRLRGGAAWMLLILILTTLTSLIAFNHSTLTARARSEPDAVAAVLAGRPMDAPAATGIGARLRLWSYGVREGLQRPVMGWGPGSTRYGLSQPGAAVVLGNENFFHLHNSYAEVFFRFGALGVVFGLCLIGLLAQALHWTALSKRIPRDYVIFLIAVPAFAAIWMMFEFQSLRYHWRFFWNLAAGSILTFYLHRYTPPSPPAA